jgi:hypothetical protein
MARPKPRRSEQLDLSAPPPVAPRQPQKAPGRETPEEIAKRLTSRRPSPLGIPHRAELTLKISLPRPLLERLTAQAIRKECRLEQIITEIIESAT